MSKRPHLEGDGGMSSVDPDPRTADVIADAQPFIQQCGPCDAGLPMDCTCPDGDYRPVMARLVAEVERLRATAAFHGPITW